MTVIYRGFLITRLAELGSSTTVAWRLAVVLGSLVFGAVHFEWGFVGVVQTAFMGLALGVAFLVLRRRLWPLILAHAVLDTVLLASLFLNEAS